MPIPSLLWLLPVYLLSPSDSAAVVSVTSRFHAAIAASDSATVLSLLAPDAVILESGGLEQREAYRRRHLPEDIAFARALPGTRTITNVVVAGDAAWVTATSSVQGQFRGRTINSAGVELMVLSRTARTSAAETNREPAWQIRAIHWSSRRRGT